jgi:hypothetical protein
MSLQAFNLQERKKKKQENSKPEECKFLLESIRMNKERKSAIPLKLQ